MCVRVPIDMYKLCNALHVYLIYEFVLIYLYTFNVHMRRLSIWTIDDYVQMIVYN